MRQHVSAGFILIELMIVVAIIAILAAISIPAYQDYLIRAQVADGMSLSTAAKVAVRDYNSNTGLFPADNATAGLADGTSISGSRVSSVDSTNDVIKVSFHGPKANSKLNTGYLELSPVSHAGSITWTCAPRTIDGKYLPTSCRA